MSDQCNNQESTANEESGLGINTTVTVFESFSGHIKGTGHFMNAAKVIMVHDGDSYEIEEQVQKESLDYMASHANVECATITSKAFEGAQLNMTLGDGVNTASVFSGTPAEIEVLHKNTFQIIKESGVEISVEQFKNVMGDNVTIKKVNNAVVDMGSKKYMNLEYFFKFFYNT
ncbi:hypothetical protein BDQ17DRAFT_1330444 [Cyathus striatus]|nr:hypothetical protein BDQ17DRAFT_1330444 [Cyathus striatus]